MEKRTRTLLLSILSLCMCTVLAVGGTFALFTGSVTTSNHLQAGNLEVGMYRTYYKETSINTNGVLADSEENKDRINLATDNSVLFDIETAVPESKYTATIEVSNLGTTAFDYGMRIIWTNKGEAEANDLALAEQIQITVTSLKLGEDGNVGSKSFRLNDCKDVGLGFMYSGAEVETFTVEVYFVNENSNNSAMSGSLELDVQVYAEQKLK